MMIKGLIKVATATDRKAYSVSVGAIVEDLIGHSNEFGFNNLLFIPLFYDIHGLIVNGQNTCSICVTLKLCSRSFEVKTGNKANC